jgi:hypothetical protein
LHKRGARDDGEQVVGQVGQPACQLRGRVRGAREPNSELALGSFKRRRVLTELDNRWVDNPAGKWVVDHGEITQRVGASALALAKSQAAGPQREVVSGRSGQRNVARGSVVYHNDNGAGPIGERMAMWVPRRVPMG